MNNEELLIKLLQGKTGKPKAAIPCPAAPQQGQGTIFSGGNGEKDHV